jgi:microcystin-dependent protein
MFNLPIPPLPIPGMGFTAPIGVPVGTVVAFAGKVESSPSNPPSNFVTNLEVLGWMVCEERLLKVSEYPELFAVLGYLYGGAGDVFKIPDYRGYFLRGVNGRSNNDPDASIRQHPSQDDKKEDGVGSRQQDALQSHQHQYDRVPKTTTILQPEKGAPAIAPLPNPGLTEQATDSLSPPGNVRTSTETRPKNVAVNYIIKYTNAL